MEREISLRTENGLYYSYFKQLVTRAPSLTEGIRDLRADNLTEYGNTINVFSRFNVHQELFLAALYKVHNFGLKPIMFYVNFVFSLQGGKSFERKTTSLHMQFYILVPFLLCDFSGLYLLAKFLIAWHLSGSWLAGVLTSAYVVVHR